MEAVVHRDVVGLGLDGLEKARNLVRFVVFGVDLETPGARRLEGAAYERAGVLVEPQGPRNEIGLHEPGLDPDLDQRDVAAALRKAKAEGVARGVAVVERRRVREGIGGPGEDEGLLPVLERQAALLQSEARRRGRSRPS